MCLVQARKSDKLEGQVQILGVQLGAAMPWIARYEDYANCKKDIARGYGNIPRSTTRLLSLL